MNKKHKLIVLSNWTHPLEKTWSGTTYSLTKALEKYYDVEIKDLSIGKCLKLLYRLSLFPIVGRYFGLLYEIALRIKANYIIGKDKSIPVFEICQDVKVNNPYFTYQDMTYYASRIVKGWREEKPYIYPTTWNSVLSNREIIRREKVQFDEYKNAVAVFFMGKWVNNLMRDYHKDIASKIYHIGGGTNIDIERIDVSQKQGNKFLFIGRDYLRKGGDLVIEAFKLLKRNNIPNAELHIAGCTPKEKCDGIFYYGDVNYNTVSDLFNKCDVFCMPSRFEAYGLVFVESLIYGLPVVARDLFEMPYFIKDGVEGALIHDDNPQILANKMIEVINNKEMIANIQANKSIYIKKYCWDSVAQRAKVVIDKTMNW